MAPANTYFEALTEAMGLLAEHPQTLFVGQAVKYDGQAGTLTVEYPEHTFQFRVVPES